MKHPVSVLLLLAAITLSLTVVGPAVSAQSRNEKVYTVAERQPEFPGGKAA